MISKEKLVLGTVQFGLNYGIANNTGKIKESEVKDILDLANAERITTLDTAIGYGTSEECLGDFEIENRFNVISKLPKVPEDCSDVFQWAKDSALSSLKRLNVNKLDGLLIHHCDELTKSYGKDLYNGLLYMKESGLVNKIGISIYAPIDLDLLVPKFDFDIIQSPLNIIDSRIITSGWADRLTEMGIELHVRSIFLQGLLLMPPQRRPNFFKEYTNICTDYDHWLSEMNVSPLAACMNYAFSFDQVNKILIGIDSLNQFQEILSIQSIKEFNFPTTLQSNDDKLINPSKWATL